MCDVCMCCIAFSFDIGRITLCPDAACFAARVQLLLVVLRHQNSGRICRLPVFSRKDEDAFVQRGACTPRWFCCEESWAGRPASPPLGWGRLAPPPSSLSLCVDCCTA